MRDTLAMLVELQTLDDALRELRETKARLAQLREENAESLAVFDQMLAEREARIDETRAFHEEKEAEIEATKEKIQRSRARLSSITSQRELTALNKELDAARRANTQRTEELLKLMEQLDQANADLEQRKKERDDLEAQMKGVEAELVEAIEKGEQEAVEYTARRKALREKLPRPLMSRYERISRGRAGLAVADVTEGGTCSACNMKVPPQWFIQLQKSESLEYCQSCQRMLIYRKGLTDQAEAAAEEAATDAAS